MPNKKTHEDYVQEVKKINPNIEVISEYIGSKIKILHKCKIDNYEWFATPSNILQGTGCPKCEKSNKKTHEKYVKEVKEINPDIEVVEQYKGSEIKILHKCKIDGTEWMARPNNILNGRGCPVCGKMSQQQQRRKLHEEYIKEVEKINPDIEVIGQYVNNFTKILHRCKIDRYDWMVNPNNVLSGNRCPRCINKERYTQEEYVKKVEKLNSNIEVIGHYIDSHTKISHCCKIDGFKWYATPNNILNGKGCPKCNQSKGEKTVFNWLDEHKVVFQQQKKFDDCKDKSFLLFDFYLPDYNILIEYNGIQHYEPVDYFGGQETFEDQIKKDNIKKEYCRKNNIFLFEIPHYSNLDEELIKLYDFIKTKDIKKEVIV